MRFLLYLSALLWVAVQPSSAQSSPSANDRCGQLKALDFSTTRDAPFMVTLAEISPDAASKPCCKVVGYAIPEVSFELEMPTAGWNHKFALVGSGGWASYKFTFLCKEPLSRGYACIAGDAGHQYNNGLWMQDDAQTKVDWGYLATHKITIAGKTLVRAFYGETPQLSLMLGCSTGGYQALVEAERFPWDFVGIVAIAPDIDEGDLSMRTAWAAHNLVGDDGRPTFAKQDLEVLHDAAIKTCDLLDGVRDGIISNPLACHFDPRSVLCKNGKTHCLTEQQVNAAMRIYGGPTTSQGESISTAGPFPGSELEWPNILEDVTFANNYFRFALADWPRDGFPASKFNYDQDYKRLGLGGTFISSNPDLRRFKSAGGKLLIAQGSNDVTEQAHAALDFYEMVERVIGSRQATQDFARLFLVPAMNHCSGGEGAFAIDYLSAIEEWTVDKTPPNKLIGAHAPAWENNDVAIEAGLTAPKPGMKVTFTRPVFPYPLFARYLGHGDVNNAANFGPADPQ
jgi:hypothetical protein